MITQTGVHPPQAEFPSQERFVGLALARLSVLPGSVVVAWLLVVLPLLLIDALRPLPALALFVPVAVIVLRVAWRVTSAGPRMRAPRWTLWALVAIATAFTMANGLLHAEKVIIRRDAASYFQIGHWLAQHGDREVPTQIEAFGGAHPLLATGSPAFYPSGEALVPQFMTGLPSTLAAVEWLTSWTATLWAPAVLGGLALLAFGGLIARLVGPTWAPLGAAVLGLAEPFWHVARATFSEPLAALLLISGLCLLVDAGRDARGGRGGSSPHGDTGGRAAAFLGGLAIGICTFVRVDALREVMILVPIVGWLAVRRHRAWQPLAGGLALGLTYGVLDGRLLTWPYLVAIEDSLRPLVTVFIAAAVATATAVGIARRVPAGRLRLRLPRWAPAAAGWLVVAAAAGFALRPLLQTVHGWEPGSGIANFVGRMQEREGLDIDPTRSYDEWTMHWLAWWLGWPTVVLGVAGAALLVRRVLSGRDLPWVPALALALGSLALVMWRPGITPDHPWADRRFVPIALPGLVLLAVYAIRLLRDRARDRARARASSPGPPLRGARDFSRPIVGLASAAVVLPSVWTGAPLFPDRAEHGSIAVIESVCEALRPGDAVLLVDARARLEWPSAVRGECGVPAVSVRDTNAAGLAEVVARTKASGGNPVLLAAASPDLIEQIDVTPVQILDVLMRTDREILMGVPTSDRALGVTVWIGRP